MTGKAKIAAILLTLTAVVYGFIPLLVDLSPTHVLHPAWSPHARFHVVWQISIGTMIALIVLYLLWVRARVGCSACGSLLFSAAPCSAASLSRR
jgi:hypothetical protein